MSGIVNKTGSSSGIVGTTESAGTDLTEISGHIKITPQSSAPVTASGNPGALWVDSTKDWIRYAVGDKYMCINIADSACSGGTLTSYESGGITYVVHSYLTTGTFSCPTDIPADILLVGGGGGGGNQHTSASYAGPGGGAGALLQSPAFTISGQTEPYTVTVGAGGAATVDGGDSIFSTLTAHGGYGTNNNAASGNNGSGNGSYSWTSPSTGGTYGNNGGTASSGYSGGGGGAGGVGANAVNGVSGGAGGSGATNDYRTGSNVTYAAGGNGASSYGSVAGSVPSGNSGGGGHGSGNSVGTAGGSGIVVIRYAI